MKEKKKVRDSKTGEEKLEDEMTNGEKIGKQKEKKKREDVGKVKMKTQEGNTE